MLKISLISTYELGRQPFGLASPAAWLRQAGYEVRCLDLSTSPLDPEAIKSADLVAFYVPMHMATRMTVPLIEQVRQLNPKAHLCAYGLYAPVSAEYLARLGVQTILGGEFETGLVALVNQLRGRPATLPTVSLKRQQFSLPDRSDLPGLQQYAQLVTETGPKLVGYTEATRGCQHLCRHCPIVPVYGGHFRVVQRDIVLADIRQQVKAGAQHITFGDPDFFNGPGHAFKIVQSLHEKFPALTYDVTIKVEHLLKQAQHLPRLKESGCLFVTTAVESFDEELLAIFDKRHTLSDFEAALTLCRELDLLLVPTFVAFTPWTTLASYRHFLTQIVRLNLVDQVAPIQCAIRLLIPPGSRLLELPETQACIGGLDETKLSYTWRNADSRVTRLQADLEVLVQRCAAQKLARRDVFRRIWERAFAGVGDLEGRAAVPDLPPSSRFVPTLTEPWYC
jgi:radical SAM superfamily enzyme YgiQ (UPF0313 family)